MDPFCSHSGPMLSRSPVKTVQLPAPTRSAERSAAMKEMPGRREKNTSPPQVESVGQPPRAQPCLRQEKEMTEGRVSRLAKPGLDPEARALRCPPTKRQSP